MGIQTHTHTNMYVSFWYGFQLPTAEMIKLTTFLDYSTEPCIQFEPEWQLNNNTPIVMSFWLKCSTGHWSYAVLQLTSSLHRYALTSVEVFHIFPSCIKYLSLHKCMRVCSFKMLPEAQNERWLIGSRGRLTVAFKTCFGFSITVRTREKAKLITSTFIIDAVCSTAMAESVKGLKDLLKRQMVLDREV